MEADSDFDVAGFEKKLTNVKDTQEGIQSLSAWCLHNHVHHKKIVTTWLNVLKQVKVEHRLVLFYLANDVIQHSKRKNYDFVESWGTALQRATTMVRDDKVKHKILRIFKIWGDRQVYDEDFLTDLNGLLSASLPKPKPKEAADSDDFQVQTVVNSVRQCVILQNETDRSMKSVIKTVLPEIPKTFKDRSQCAALKKQIDDDVRRHERYIQNLKAEIKARNLLIAALQQADEFYQTQRGEVKVVANAYKNFGNRVKNMKKKLDELSTTLPSPIPSPDINAPSPGPDNDFELPADGSFAGFSNNGFMTYMEGSLPFDPMDFNRKSPSPPVKSIQVINSNTPGGDSFANSGSTINDFFKSLIPEAYDPGSSLSFNEYSMNSSSGSFAGVPAPSAAPLPAYAPITMSNYGMSGNPAGFNRNNYTNQGSGAVPPPPLPPPPQMEQSSNSRYNNWEPTWNPRQNPHSANPLLDTPHSPPHYERKAVNPSAPIEYVDLEAGSLEAGGDVDHRTLTDILRVADIDHRNLISLTGSPRDIENTALAGDKISEDIDFRKHLFNLDPPPPPTLDEKIASMQTGDADFRVAGSDEQENSADDDGLGFDLSSFNPSILPPILEPPSLGDLAKLLDTKSGLITNDSRENVEGHVRKKQKSHNGNDDAASVDMEMSDEEGNQIGGKNSDQEELSQISSKTSYSNNERESPPDNNSLQPPPLPNFNFDQWNDSQEIMDDDNGIDEMDNQIPYGMHDQQEQGWNTASPTNAGGPPQWGMLGQRLLQMSQTVPGTSLPPTPPAGYMQRPPLMPMPPNRPPMFNNQQPHPGYGSPNFNNNRGRGRGMMNRGGVMLRGGPFFRGSPGGVPRPFRGGGNFRGGPPRGRW